MTVSVSQKSQEAVVGCLGLYDKLTVEEIVEFTDISKSTVHRVLNSDPRITSHKGKGKAWLYSIDKEAVARDFRVESRKARRQVERNDIVAQYLANFKKIPLEKQAAAWAKGFQDAIQTIERITEQKYNALALQGEDNPLSPEAAQAHWNQWRDEMETVAVLGVTLTRYCEAIIDHPFARSPTWFLQFPKETK